MKIILQFGTIGSGGFNGGTFNSSPDRVENNGKMGYENMNNRKTAKSFERQGFCTEDGSTQVDPNSNKQSSDKSKNDSGNNSSNDKEGSSKEESKEGGSKEDSKELISKSSKKHFHLDFVKYLIDTYISFVNKL